MYNVVTDCIIKIQLNENQSIEEVNKQLKKFYGFVSCSYQSDETGCYYITSMKYLEFEEKTHNQTFTEKLKSLGIFSDDYIKYAKVFLYFEFLSKPFHIFEYENGKIKNREDILMQEKIFNKSFYFCLDVKRETGICMFSPDILFDFHFASVYDLYFGTLFDNIERELEKFKNKDFNNYSIMLLMLHLHPISRRYILIEENILTDKDLTEILTYADDKMMILLCLIFLARNFDAFRDNEYYQDTIKYIGKLIPESLTVGKTALICYACNLLKYTEDIENTYLKVKEESGKNILKYIDDKLLSKKLFTLKYLQD